MSVLNRRHFIAGSAAAAASARSAAAAESSEVDILIVGAGAAGIAAARRIAATGARYALVEASPRIGGRCLTDSTTFGVPYDRGAHWIHRPDLNPVVPLAAGAGLDIYPAPPNQVVRVGRRNARSGEMEDYITSLVRANRSIADAGRSGKGDVSCGQVLPKDLGEWQRTIEFVLGPYGCAKDLANISAADFARSVERDTNSFCRQGFGALIAKLGADLPVQFSNPVTRIDWGGRIGVEVDTRNTHFSAGAVIITVSTGVLLSGKLVFAPDLPKRQLDAIDKLRLGSYDRIALELPGNPLGLDRDATVFEQAESGRTAALLANVTGTPLCFVDVGGRFGRDLSAGGDKAMISFAVDWLASLYGPNIKSAVKRTHATRWNDEPWILGAFSAAAPGGQGARAILAEPLRDRLFFAGEATHETLWGTVGGAWLSGQRAAEASLRRLGFIAEPPDQKRAPPSAPPQTTRRR